MNDPLRTQLSADEVLAQVQSINPMVLELAVQRALNARLAAEVLALRGEAPGPAAVETDHVAENRRQRQERRQRGERSDGARLSPPEADKPATPQSVDEVLARMGDG
jgi:hypothetical protein